MTHPDYIRAKARELRTERHLTIDEIAERLALSRTTIYHWVRDLPIERSTRPPMNGQANGTLAMQAKYRLARESAYAEGRATFDELARDRAFRDFAASISRRDRSATATACRCATPMPRSSSCATGRSADSRPSR